jgi:hypothetical protein
LRGESYLSGDDLFVRIFGLTRKGVFQFYFLPRVLRLCFRQAKSVIECELFTGPPVSVEQQTPQQAIPRKHARPDRQLHIGDKGRETGQLVTSNHRPLCSLADCEQREVFEGAGAGVDGRPRGARAAGLTAPKLFLRQPLRPKSALHTCRDAAAGALFKAKKAEVTPTRATR